MSGQARRVNGLARNLTNGAANGHKLGAYLRANGLRVHTDDIATAWEVDVTATARLFAAVPSLEGLTMTYALLDRRTGELKTVAVECGTHVNRPALQLARQCIRQLQRQVHKAWNGHPNRDTP